MGGGVRERTYKQQQPVETKRCVLHLSYPFVVLLSLLLMLQLSVELVAARLDLYVGQSMREMNCFDHSPLRPAKSHRPSAANSTCRLMKKK